MNLRDMLLKLDAGAELRYQLDGGVASYWIQSRTPGGNIVQEPVQADEAVALIGTAFVSQIEINTDGDGAWFEGFQLSAAGRSRVETMKVADGLEILDRAPDVQPDAGDELPDPPSSKM